ncbi:MAG TPA: flagellar motor switch protein FliM [Burkholderiaceae bacterium]|jgi:flagellar motor switch protein FliM|nr:flagellar motor switch protein FliM [Burkholderiaceae bacterium]
MADQFLSQEEVDALLDGVNGDTPETSSEEQTGVRAYDLGKQERIVRGRMPTLEIINERFARNIRLGLFNFMRRNPEISVGQSKVQKYSAFLRNIVVPTNINIMSVRPLRGSALVICEPALVFTIIDNLFGGSGKLHTRIEGRDFSPTEQRIILRIVEVINEEYRKAWEGVYPLVFEYVRSEMHTQFANIATPSEIMVTTSFDIEIGEAGGAMHICIPYSTLEPIREMLYSSVRADQQQADKRWVNLLTQQLKSADVMLTAEFTSTQATVQQLMSLKPGDFIGLDLPETVIAKVDKVPVFECHYGVSSGRYAIKVNEIVTNPKEILSGGQDE